MTAPKFPPHLFTRDPVRWAFTAGGAVSHVPGSMSIACERCHETMGARSSASVIAEFLHRHAGQTCSSAPSGAKRKR